MAEIVEKRGPGDQGTRGPGPEMAEILILVDQTRVDQCGPVWTSVDQCGPVWTSVDQCGPAWTIVISGPVWTSVG